MFSLICASINGCVNNDKADDFRRHRAHYDVAAVCITAYTLLGADPLYNQF